MMTRTEVVRVIHMAGAGVVASLGYLMTNEGDLPHAWKVGLGAVIAGLVTVGAYMATPPTLPKKEEPIERRDG